MKSYGRIFLLAVVLVAVSALSVLAVPGMINYQGKLTDSDSYPLDGTYQVQFHIYDAATGGSELWSETQSVTVTDGIYNVQLGSVTPLTAGVFSSDAVYLEVVILNDDTSTWETLSPRQRLTSTAFSFRAADAESLEGHASSEFALTTHQHDGSDITSGTIDEARIPDSIARDGEVFGIVTGSDGSGSGLDADLLDGKDSSEFGTASQVATNQSNISALQAALTNLQATVNSLSSQVSDLQDRVDTLEAENAELKKKLKYVTVSGTDMYITGANLYIRSGSGSTDGTVNGLGNLIIGYNEPRSTSPDQTGSHNLIIGRYHNYSSYGGIVVGYYNTISAAYATVSGGHHNTASGFSASVSGGHNNEASGSYASVNGGRSNQASGYYASVSGGYENIASGDYASVSGGWINEANSFSTSVSGGFSNTASGSAASVSGGGHNTAGGTSASVSGGEYNTASYPYATVSGGEYNTASGYYASVSGGSYNQASGSYSFVAGGGGPNEYDGNIAFANYSAILGGLNNLAGDGTKSWNSDADRYVVSPGSDHGIGQQACVSGGAVNIASGFKATVSGGHANTASGESASISGGSSNSASGADASVSGGYYNTASGSGASVSGGYYNTASDYSASVSGGRYNAASGDFASVSGGTSNTASGYSASVSGGYDRGASDTYDWRGGQYFSDQ